MAKKYLISTISDLHNKHKEWENNLRYHQWGYNIEEKYDKSDILIFSGDCTSKGTKREFLDFLQWFSNQPQLIKIMIGGNHDFILETLSENDIKDIIPNNIIYLNDSLYQHDNLKIWGSPIQPYFNNWAFNRKRGNDIKKHWDMIPDDIDILIVHGPPRNILDKISPIFQRYNENINVGCDDLRDAVLNRIKPKLMVFGHIHESYGNITINNTTFINASCLNENYRAINKPHFFEIIIE